MRVLSFDVGIKNLAFCLLNQNDKLIEDWGILNICVDPLCDHCMKDSQCDKSAMYQCDNFKVCTAHQKLKKYEDHKWKKIPKCKNAVFETGKKMVQTLDEKTDFLGVDVVIIENQPALKNPTMKTIQMMLYSYFLIKGVMVQERDMSSIEMINARNKLKAYKGPEIPCDIKDKYKRTKYLGVEYCRKMIHENEKIDPKWLSLFDSSKKKDDLSDAYLQGMYYLGD
jgi:hypothetical protein